MEGLKTEINPVEQEKAKEVEEELKELERKKAKLQEELKKKKIEEQKIDVPDHKHCRDCHKPMPITNQSNVCIVCKPD